jgi:hypothetical protein
MFIFMRLFNVSYHASTQAVKRRIRQAPDHSPRVTREQDRIHPNGKAGIRDAHTNGPYSHQ